MKKMVFMAAFVAATAAFVACSSNDDLVQQKPDVPEEPTVQYPMTLIVSAPSTRGTDFDATSLRKFKMYSNYHNTWYNGALFEKNDNGAWVNKYNAQMAWSETDVTNKATYTFYGVNDFDNFSVVSAVTQKPTVLENTVSFGYTMPTNTRDTNDDGNPDESYVNYEDQVDLLVAKATAGPDVGNPKGALNVEFDHALALIHKIYVYANPANIYADEVDLWHFRINSIKIGGLKNAGTYTFGKTKIVKNNQDQDVEVDAPWDVNGDDVEIEIPLDIPTDDAEAFTRMTFVPGAKNSNAVLELPLTDDGIYIIPQQLSGYVGDNEDSNKDYQVFGPYAELEMQGVTMEDTAPTYQVCYEEKDTNNEYEYGWNWQTSKANGYKKVRTPLKFDISTGAGKVYNLYIDISKAIVCEDTESDYHPDGSLAVGGEIDFGAN